VAKLIFLDPDDDPIGVEGGYDPRRFYTRASHPKDNGKSLIHVNPGTVGEKRTTVRVPDWMAAAVQNAVNVFPGYKNQGDVVRDAIFHRLQMLLGLTEEPGFRLYIEGETYKEVVWNLLQEKLRDQEFFNNLCDTLAEISQMYDQDLMETALRDISDAAEGLPNPVYQQKFLEQIEVVRQNPRRRR